MQALATAPSDKERRVRHRQQHRRHDGTSEWDGVVFNGANGKIYGGNEATVSTDAEIPAGYTLAIGDGQTLTVAPGATLAVKGAS